jgi:hypothetical protein
VFIRARLLGALREAERGQRLAHACRARRHIGDHHSLAVAAERVLARPVLISAEVQNIASYAASVFHSTVLAAACQSDLACTLCASKD